MAKELSYTFIAHSPALGAVTSWHVFVLMLPKRPMSLLLTSRHCTAINIRKAKHMHHKSQFDCHTQFYTDVQDKQTTLTVVKLWYVAYNSFRVFWLPSWNYILHSARSQTPSCFKPGNELFLVAFTLKPTAVKKEYSVYMHMQEAFRLFFCFILFNTYFVFLVVDWWQEFDIPS